MATTVTTSTASYATVDGRHTGVTSAGVDWVMQYSLANTRMEFWYSTDDGATWTESTSLRNTIPADEVASAEFYIGDHDRAVFAHGGSGGNGFFVTSSLTSTATWTTIVDNDLVARSRVRCRVFDFGTGEYAAVRAYTDGDLKFDVGVFRTSDNAFLVQSSLTIEEGVDTIFDFDFQHTGDGKTSGVTNPALFVVYRAFPTGYATFVKLNGVTRSWTAGTKRTVEATAGAATDAMCATFDGSRFIMSFIDDDSDLLPKWFERDAADTTTTERTVPALSDGAITSLSQTFDVEGDNRLFAVGTTSDDVKYVVYDRSAGTFGAWTTHEATTATAESMSVQPGFQGDGVNVVWTSGAGSPYDVLFERQLINTSPLAPTWSSPSNNSAQNTAGSLPLTWVFNDVDDGDTQSAYALSRSVDGGALAYYNAGAGTWGASETKNTSTTSAVTLASSWGVDDESHVYKVKVWDAADAEGPYSSGLTVTGSTAVTPVLTAPTDTSTIITNTVTVTWTATEQTAYRVRLLTSADAVLYDSGKVTSTALTLTPATILADGLTSAKAEVRVWNDDDLEGATDTHTFTVDFVEPATATLELTADNASGAISVAITDPTPTGSQPTVTSHDLYVRVADGGRQIGERTVNDDGIRIVAGSADATLYDYAAASGVDFEYRVLAIADNGTSSWSAWT